MHYNTELISVIWTLAACTLLHFTFALKKDFIEIGLQRFVDVIDYVD